MAKLIVFSASAGFLLLMISTIALVVLNRSEKILAPVLSILLVGTATTLATILAILKESNKQESFVTSVVFDSVTGAPASITPDQGDPKLVFRLSELSDLGRPAVTRNGMAEVTIQRPETEDQRFRFCAELLQYRIVQIINKIQRGGSILIQTGRSVRSAASVPMKLSRIEDVPGRTFLPIVGVNRFSNSDMEHFWWEHGHFPVPKKTRVSLIHQPSSSTTGVEKFVVRFEKSLFFRIDFVVEPLPASGEGVVPEGLRVDAATAAHWRTYPFQVTMRATFDKITAGNWETEEYKNWADWLFSRVRDSLAD
jgi:hypothetical protein